MSLVKSLKDWKMAKRMKETISAWAEDVVIRNALCQVMMKGKNVL